MEDWDGSERRSSRVTLQDVLLEVREGRSEVRHLISDFKSHIDSDEKNFAALKEDIQRAKNDTALLQKIFFGITGAWLLFQFLVTSGALSLNSYFSTPDNNGPNNARNNSSHVGRHQDPSGEGGLVRRPGVSPTQ